MRDEEFVGTLWHAIECKHENIRAGHVDGDGILCREKVGVAVFPLARRALVTDCEGDRPPRTAAIRRRDEFDVSIAGLISTSFAVSSKPDRAVRRDGAAVRVIPAM